MNQVGLSVDVKVTSLILYIRLVFLIFLIGSMVANSNYYTSMMSEGTHPVDFEDFSNPCNEQQS